MKSLQLLFALQVFLLPSFGNERIGGRLRSFLETGSQEPLFVWIHFADKDPVEIRKLSTPHLLVSDRSIQRRLKARASEAVVDHMDIPINDDYIADVERIVGRIRHRSRWFNAVSAQIRSDQIRDLLQLHFVKKIELMARFRRAPFDEFQEEAAEASSRPSHVMRSASSLDYGPSFNQVNLINVPAVHDSGNFGQGVIVGVFDNGFRLLSHEVFDSLSILATYDFVDHKVDVVPNNPSSGFGGHGINTLSVIAGYEPGQLIGPAFGASYVLARTENDSSETPFEEDNWIAAIEWADSIGVDVTSTSLIYREYDPPFQSWTWEDMDGNTTMITRAADLAVSKGIVVVNAAGNFGESSIAGQNTLGAPADGDSVITVGAVDPTGARASFSSVGPTTSIPPRTKPDVMAQGTLIQVASSTIPTGYSSFASGTSFACPLAAGVAALLVHAVPTATPIEITNSMRQTASNRSAPNDLIGWGILDAVAAIEYLRLSEMAPDNFILTQNYPNPFNSRTTISFGLPVPAFAAVEVFDVLGQKIRDFPGEYLGAGSHARVWDGRDARGALVSSGVYLYRLIAISEAGTFILDRKSILVR